MDSETERTTPNPHAGASGDSVIHVSDWVRRHRPHLEQLVNPEPDPVLLEDNLVAFAPDPATGRDVALAFERIRTDHSEIGTVVLGSTADVQPPSADAEHVTGDAARKALIGAVIGAVVFAAIIGLLTWALFGGAPAVLGGVIGGALFGAGSVAMWGYVISTGQSPAYRESFVDPDAVQIVAVSVHADDRTCIDAARQAVADIDGLELHRIDRAGRRVP
ncbi:MAG TPA: hypothetical protein VK860_00615 [Ilumatobacteraceae bacterium]|nr:hypothetical protein [Ilumatobacteraceae bacterium]